MALVSNLQLAFLGHVKNGGVPGASNELSCTIQSVGNLFKDPVRDLPVCLSWVRLRLDIAHRF